MINRNVGKDVITLYNYLEKRDKTGNLLGLTYKRTVLTDCVWSQDSSATFKKTGVLNKDSVSINISYDPGYVSTETGEKFKGIGWTVALGPELKSTYIVRGVCPYHFSYYTLKPVEPVNLDKGNILDLETGLFNDAGFYKNYIEPFEKTVQYKKPKEIIETFIGSRLLWKIEVRC